MPPIIRATNDVFFKYLLGRPENADLLMSFINSVLADSIYPPVTAVTIMNPFNLQDHFEDKLSILDIKASSADGRQYDIEVQTGNIRAFFERILYYWARLYSTQLKDSEAYTELKPVISISILDFLLFPDISRHLSWFMIAERNDPELILTDHLSICFLELPKLKTGHPHLKLEEWMYYFINEGSEAVKILSRSNPVFNKAHKDYLAFSEDERLRAVSLSREIGRRDYISGLEYARRDGLEKGMEDGLEKGRKEGLEKGMDEGRAAERLELARRLKTKGMSSVEIMECTGLDGDEIKKL